MTSRPTYSGTYYDYSSTTVTATTDTYTRTFPSYNATITISSPGVNPSTATSFTTITDTLYIPTATRASEICTSTLTKTLEYTTTTYTGTYIPSPLSSYCPTSTSTSPIYLGGTIHTTVTSTSYPSPSFTTSYSPAGRTTTTLFDTSVTATGTVTLVAYVSSGIYTTTYAVSCTSTTFTATASGVTATQALRCAPTNLINDVAYIQYYNPAQSFAPGQQTVDASSCCQICAEIELCAVSNFNNGFCDLRLAWGVDEDGTCGVAERVVLGDYGFAGGVSQAGCGRVEREDLA
ncbi:hypothetical protein LTR95_011427 [Oleoguttula sp. CCFEE 5521]